MSGWMAPRSGGYQPKGSKTPPGPPPAGPGAASPAFKCPNGFTDPRGCRNQVADLRTELELAAATVTNLAGLSLLREQRADALSAQRDAANARIGAALDVLIEADLYATEWNTIPDYDRVAQYIRTALLGETP